MYIYIYIDVYVYTYIHIKNKRIYVYVCIYIYISHLYGRCLCPSVPDPNLFLCSLDFEVSLYYMFMYSNVFFSSAHRIEL